MSLRDRLHWQACLIFCTVLVITLTCATAQAETYIDIHDFNPFPHSMSPRARLLKGADGNYYGSTYGPDAISTIDSGSIFRITPTGVITTLKLLPISEHINGGLTQAADGTIYGSTDNGGDHLDGSIFKIDANGNLTTLYSFSLNDVIRGASPNSVVIGSDGKLYGTESDGVNGYGAVFCLDTNGTLTILHSFANADGATPKAGLVIGSDGALYGTTSAGGSLYHGTIFRITPNGSFSTLHNFDGSDGYDPEAELVVDAASGVLYGTTVQGGANSKGTVFSITTSGSFALLHSFNGTDGANPKSSLSVGEDGWLYGTTSTGGASNDGTVFRISSAGDFSTLHSFTGVDGKTPLASLTETSAGVFTGDTSTGGSFGFGNIFQISETGSYSVLYSFEGLDGSTSMSALTPASDNTFYGTTASGGAYNFGTVFRVTTAGDVSILHSFDGINGGAPNASVIVGNDGNLYGTAPQGAGYGSVFSLDPLGRLSILHTFSDTDGAMPIGGLLEVGNDVFYGMTATGGAYNAGTIYKITSTGILSTVHSFNGSPYTSISEGGAAVDNLVEGSDGNLYGTSTGGPTNNGSVFKITQAGLLTILHLFSGASDGGNPEAPLVLGSDGNFYGTTSEGGSRNDGTIFRITTSGELTTLHTFSGTSDGAVPVGALIQTANGVFYGTTSWGGVNDIGVIFQMTPDGTVTDLYSFSNPTGDSPQGSLVLGSDGCLYGTTMEGGAFHHGVVFKLGLPPDAPSGLTSTPE